MEFFGSLSKTFSPRSATLTQVLSFSCGARCLGPLLKNSFNNCSVARQESTYDRPLLSENDDDDDESMDYRKHWNVIEWR
jgi:hypothetical protein